MTSSRYCKQQMVQRLLQAEYPVRKVPKSTKVKVPQRTVCATVRYKAHRSFSCSLQGSGQIFKLMLKMLTIIEERMKGNNDAMLKLLNAEGYAASRTMII